MLDRELESFIEIDERPRSLLHIYYAGHGILGEQNYRITWHWYGPVISAYRMQVRFLPYVEVKNWFQKYIIGSEWTLLIICTASEAEQPSLLWTSFNKGWKTPIAMSCLSSTIVIAL